MEESDSPGQTVEVMKDTGANREGRSHQSNIHIYIYIYPNRKRMEKAYLSEIPSRIAVFERKKERGILLIRIDLGFV